jgi:dynein heavy chain
MSSGGSGKSNDEVVYELAESIEGKLMDNLNIENAHEDMFEVSG